MTLFSAPNDPWSHRTRIVLAEKGISIDIVSVEPGKLPEDLLDLNPYHSVPTLVDRDLVLYDSRVIIEYLDERFPHPPLTPADPGARGAVRLALPPLPSCRSIRCRVHSSASRSTASSATGTAWRVRSMPNPTRSRR